MSDVRILTFSSSATATKDCVGHVVVSGSYGGEYNAWHAAKWGIRGLIRHQAARLAKRAHAPHFQSAWKSAGTVGTLTSSN